MYPDKVTVRMYRYSYGLYTRPDDQNTLTRQYADTNNTTRETLHSPLQASSFHDTMNCETNSYTSLDKPSIQPMYVANSLSTMAAADQRSIYARLVTDCKQGEMYFVRQYLFFASISHYQRRGSVR